MSEINGYRQIAVVMSTIASSFTRVARVFATSAIAFLVFMGAQFIFNPNLANITLTWDYFSKYFICSVMIITFATDVRLAPTGISIIPKNSIKVKFLNFIDQLLINFGFYAMFFLSFVLISTGQPMLINLEALCKIAVFCLTQVIPFLIFSICSEMCPRAKRELRIIFIPISTMYLAYCLSVFGLPIVYAG